MKITTNKLMMSILKNRKIEFTSQNVSLPNELDELINSGFREEEGCILFKDYQYFGPGELDSELKKSEYEIFLNDINISDYVSEKLDEFEKLKIGVECGKRIYEQLNKHYQKDFRVLIYFGETLNGNEIDIYDDCIVKFHVIRVSCEDELKEFGIESKSEGVLIIQ
ncbi:hypothetical protein [Chryseobacterium luteum]|nr:hypothetical protein [Chryseobacterium luteum]